MPDGSGWVESGPTGREKRAEPGKAAGRKQYILRGVQELEQDEGQENLPGCVCVCVSVCADAHVGLHECCADRA